MTKNVTKIELLLEAHTKPATLLQLKIIPFRYETETSPLFLLYNHCVRLWTTKSVNITYSMSTLHMKF